MSVVEALLAATLNSARIVDMEGVAGTIETGKRADLVLLAENPLENLDGLRRIECVFSKGRMFEPRFLRAFNRWS